MTTVTTSTFTLPQGWDTRFDTSSGRFYYFHIESQTSQWDPPTVTSTPSPPPAATPAVSARLPKGWDAHYDASSQRFYYVDLKTNTTQWDPPALTSNPPTPPVPKAAPPPVPQLPEGWDAHWDASSRRYYYVNVKNNTTQWDPPTTISAPPPAPHPVVTVAPPTAEPVLSAPMAYAQVVPKSPVIVTQRSRRAVAVATIAKPVDGSIRALDTAAASSPAIAVKTTTTSAPSMPDSGAIAAPSASTADAVPAARVSVRTVPDPAVPAVAVPTGEEVKIRPSSSSSSDSSQADSTKVSAAVTKPVVKVVIGSIRAPPAQSEPEYDVSSSSGNAIPTPVSTLPAVSEPTNPPPSIQPSTTTTTTTSNIPAVYVPKIKVTAPAPTPNIPSSSSSVPATNTSTTCATGTTTTTTTTTSSAGPAAVVGGSRPTWTPRTHIPFPPYDPYVQPIALQYDHGSCSTGNLCHANAVGQQVCQQEVAMPNQNNNNMNNHMNKSMEAAMKAMIVGGGVLMVKSALGLDVDAGDVAGLMGKAAIAGVGAQLSEGGQQGGNGGGKGGGAMPQLKNLRSSMSKLLKPGSGSTTAGSVHGSRQITLNEYPLNVAQMQWLAQHFNIHLQPQTHYWYDRQSGFFGAVGQPCSNMIDPLLGIRGEVHPRASLGNAKVWFNGREIPTQERLQFQALGMPLPDQSMFFIDPNGDVSLTNIPGVDHPVQMYNWRAKMNEVMQLHQPHKEHTNVIKEFLQDAIEDQVQDAIEDYFSDNDGQGDFGAVGDILGGGNANVPQETYYYTDPVAPAGGDSFYSAAPVYDNAYCEGSGATCLPEDPGVFMMPSIDPSFYGSVFSEDTSSSMDSAFMGLADGSIMENLFSF